MQLIDTHTHLFLDEFKEDKEEVVDRAIKSGIKRMLLPHIDSGSTGQLLDLADKYPLNCLPMMGLHPSSVNKDFEKELENVEYWLSKRSFIAIGETGIDLYWDKTFFKEQVMAFEKQIALAIDKDLPIVIHCRNAFDEIYTVLEKYKNTSLRGVFHCFTGSMEQADKVISLNFKLGIGGVVTFKNSGLDKVVEQIPIEHILLETDSPFLASMPFRGKRNESAYLKQIAQKLAELLNRDIEEIAAITTENALKFFRLSKIE